MTHCWNYIQEAEGHGNAVVLRADTVLFTSVVDTLLHCCQKHRRLPEVIIILIYILKKNISRNGNF